MTTIITTDDPRGWIVRRPCEECARPFDDLSPRRERKLCDDCRDSYETRRRPPRRKPS